MKETKPIIWIIGVLVVVVLGVVLFGQSNNPATISETANDDPDVITANLIDSAQVTPTPVESNPALVSSDADITSGFDQVTDTTDL